MNFTIGGINFNTSYSNYKDITHEGKALVDNIEAIGNDSIRLKDCFTPAGGNKIKIATKKGNIEIIGSDINSNINGDVSSKTGKIILKNISIRNVEVNKSGLEMEHCHINGTLSLCASKTDEMPESGAHNLKIGEGSLINTLHVKNNDDDRSSWITRKISTPHFMRNFVSMEAEFSRKTDQTENAIPLKSEVTLGVHSVLKSIVLDEGISCTLVVPDSARFDGNPTVSGLTVINRP